MSLPPHPKNLDLPSRLDNLELRHMQVLASHQRRALRCAKGLAVLTLDKVQALLVGQPSQFDLGLLKQRRKTPCVVLEAPANIFERR
jgi:hypothetical protein